MVSNNWHTLYLKARLIRPFIDNGTCIECSESRTPSSIILFSLMVCVLPPTLPSINGSQWWKLFYTLAMCVIIWNSIMNHFKSSSSLQTTMKNFSRKKSIQKPIYVQYMFNEHCSHTSSGEREEVHNLYRSELLSYKWCVISLRRAVFLPFFFLNHLLFEEAIWTC